MHYAMQGITITQANHYILIDTIIYRLKHALFLSGLLSSRETDIDQRALARCLRMGKIDVIAYKYVII